MIFRKCDRVSHSVTDGRTDGRPDGRPAGANLEVYIVMGNLRLQSKDARFFLGTRKPADSRRRGRTTHTGFGTKLCMPEAELATFSND